MYLSTLGLRVIKKKKKVWVSGSTAPHTSAAVEKFLETKSADGDAPCKGTTFENLFKGITFEK